jgi:hypothetical protein
MTPNLEQDMRDAKWFVDKVRATESYAQNVYAALCNNAFQKLEVLPVLRDEIWSCSWRYAGGIVALLRSEGDYMDWYCSGIHGDPKEIDYAAAEAQGFNPSRYVAESVVTDEIRQDLEQLGWVVIDDYYDEI